METYMKLSITLSALLIGGSWPPRRNRKRRRLVPVCRVSGGLRRKGRVVLLPRPVALPVATPGVGRVVTPTNRGGPVDRVGRR